MVLRSQEIGKRDHRSGKKMICSRSRDSGCCLLMSQGQTLEKDFVDLRGFFVSLSRAKGLVDLFVDHMPFDGHTSVFDDKPLSYKA